ncbi:MAG TPA: DUF4129 domain-containing protein [Acidimicrobiales bacterium]|nr:DUF4129 domain-containing protein [Acidimicrobiales bacterium]
MLRRAPVELAPPANDPNRVRGLAKSILGRPEFRPRRRSVLDAAWHWLTTEVGKLLARLFGGGSPGSSLAADVVVGVVLAAVIALVVVTVVRRGGARRRPGRPAVVFRDDRAAMSPAAWRAEAAAHEAAGRWREALRCRYRALVAELAGRGVVEEVPGRTSGEYRHDVTFAAPAAAPAFAGATDLFEQAWYGDRPTGRGDQAAFDDLARRVLVPVGAPADAWDLHPPS